MLIIFHEKQTKRIKLTKRFNHIMMKLMFFVFYA
jgi:hypothetical protein